MKTTLIIFILNLLSMSFCWANPTETANNAGAESEVNLNSVSAQWETGSVILTNGRLALKFGNEDPQILTNILPDYEFMSPEERDAVFNTEINRNGNGGSNTGTVKNYVRSLNLRLLPLAKESRELPQNLREFDLIPATETTRQSRRSRDFMVLAPTPENKPFSSMKATRFQINPRRWMFVLAENNGKETLSLNFLNVREVGQNQWAVDQNYEDIFRGNIYPNEMGFLRFPEVAGTEIPTFGVFVYDNWSMSLRWFLFNVVGDARTTGLEIKQEKLFLLPQAFKPDRPFSEGGTIKFIGDESFDDDDIYSGLVLETHDGRKNSLLFRYQHGVDENAGKNARGFEERKKRGTRAAWEHGRTAIDKYLESAKSIREPLVDIRKSLAAWFSSFVPHNANTARTPKTSPIDLLYVTFSDELRHFLPQSRIDIAQELNQKIGSRIQKEAVDSHFFYVKLPTTEPAVTLKMIACSMVAAAVDNRDDRDKSPLFFIVDALDVSTPAEKVVIGEFVDMLVNILKQGGHAKSNVALLVRGVRLDYIKTDSNMAKYASGEFIISADEALLSERRVEIVRNILTTGGTEYTIDQIEPILSAIQSRMNTGTDPFRDLGALTRGIFSILTRIAGAETDKMPDPQLVARMYAQISGAPTVGPFTSEMLRRADIIPRVLSKSYPGHSPDALHGRDSILESISTRITSWMATGHKKRPFLFFYLHGDTGTGKTMMAEAIARHLHAAMEYYNVSPSNDRAAPIPKRWGRGSSAAMDDEYFSAESFRESRHVAAIRDKIQNLRLDPNPIKILIVDESHADPEILKDILPATGNTDRKDSPLNFDGIIVIMISNVNTDTETYKALVVASPDSAEITPLNVKLFRNTFAGGGKDSDKEITADTPMGKIALAVAGRIVKSIYFFPPISLDRKQQASMVDTILVETESENNIRIVMQPSAMEHLAQVAAATKDGNFRSVEAALREELDAAFARFLIDNPGSTLHGYYLATKSSRNNRRSGLELIEVGNDPRGISVIVQDAYLRFINSVKHALELQIDTLKAEGGSSDSSRFMLDHLQNLAAGFLNAAQVPLFQGTGSSQGPHISRENTPESISNIIPEALPYENLLALPLVKTAKQLMEGPIQELFLAFTGRKVSADGNVEFLPATAENMPKQTQIIDAVHRILGGLTTLNSLPSRGANPKFQQWLQRLVRISTVVPAAGAGGNLQSESHFPPEPPATPLQPGASAAIARAAGYLTVQLALENARTMFKDLRKDASNSAWKASQHAAAAAETGAPEGPECQRLLDRGQAMSDELKAVLEGRTFGL